MKFIDDICDKIVSPPKVRYSPYDLGSMFTAYGKRQDFQIINNKGLRLQVSFYQSHQQHRQHISIVYLHSMNGSRLESTTYADQILKMGYSFCSFDFSGCGNSEGSTISFGANQKYDVLGVLQSLKQKFDIRKVVLWGRSMGSVCAIKYCELMKNHNWVSYRKDIIGLVLDSCFESFSRLAVEIGHKNSDFPEFMIKAGYYIIKSTIQEKGQFKIDELQLQPIVATLQIPVLFLTSPDDVTVSSHHSESLFAKYNHHRKRLRYIKGLHNQSRDADYLKEIKDFIGEVVREDRNTLNTPFIELQANRFQKIMHQKRNFVVEADQNSKEENGCSCSLFSGATTRSSSYQQFPTRRRIMEPPIQKVKLSKRVLSPNANRGEQDRTHSSRQY